VKGRLTVFRNTKQKDGQMPQITEQQLVTFSSPNGRLDTIQEGERRWARVGQICPTLGVHERTFERIIQRYPELVPAGHTAMLPWPSDGGVQLVRAYTMDVVLNVAMEVNNRQARRLRRWLLAMLRGQAPVPRAPSDSLARLPDARAILAQPSVQAAIGRLDALDAADAAHQKRQARERAEVTRQASMQGLTLDGLRKLRTLERILAEIPSISAQTTLALDA
jgi:hypothetical protein